MCDVCGETFFNEKNLYKWGKHGFVISNLSQKDCPLRLSSKEKVLGSVVKKEELAEGPLTQEMSHLEKG